MPNEKPAHGDLQHMDWAKAMANHQTEEQLRAFLAEYPADLRRKVLEMRQALELGDYERLQEAAQQVMGSASFVGATQLHNFVSDLVEATDESEGKVSITDKTEKAAKEAEELERELVKAGFAQEQAAGDAAKSNTSKKGEACCAVL
mmetsp:Transcript_73967/g.90795  ORF Transcript_73967/g.90795 Transcript_73967/m.90795 type:complete len:147 (+) Transcript_73967:48-488(+)